MTSEGKNVIIGVLFVILIIFALVNGSNQTEIEQFEDERLDYMVEIDELKTQVKLIEKEYNKLKNFNESTLTDTVVEKCPIVCFLGEEPTNPLSMRYHKSSNPCNLFTSKLRIVDNKVQVLYCYSDDAISLGYLPCSICFDDKTTYNPSSSNNVTTTHSTLNSTVEYTTSVQSTTSSKKEPLISDDDFISYSVLLISLCGCIFCPFWIAKPQNKKDRFYAIYSFIGCIFMLCLSLFLIFA